MTYFQKYPISQKYCYLPLHLETPYRNIVWWFEGAGGSLFIYCTLLYFCSLTPMPYFYESNESFPGPTLVHSSTPSLPGRACHSPYSTGVAVPLPTPFLAHTSLRTKSSLLLIPLSHGGPWFTQVLNTCSWNIVDDILRGQGQNPPWAQKVKKASQNFQSWPLSTFLQCKREIKGGGHG